MVPDFSVFEIAFMQFVSVPSPLHFGGAFFSLEVFLLSPLHFGAASFFIRGLSFEPLSF
jgi:hypothetical protein